MNKILIIGATSAIAWCLVQKFIQEEIVFF